MEARDLILKTALSAQWLLENQMLQEGRMNRCANTEALNEYLRVQDQPESAAVILERQNNRQRVINVANILIEPGHEFFNNGERWSFDHVIDELINHDLFPNAMARLMKGDEKPLKDLTLRVARHLAATILNIDPDDIGIFI